MKLAQTEGKRGRGSNNYFNGVGERRVAVAATATISTWVMLKHERVKTDPPSEKNINATGRIDAVERFGRSATNAYLITLVRKWRSPT
jgi:hypothetical protein